MRVLLFGNRWPGPHHHGHRRADHTAGRTGAAAFGRTGERPSVAFRRASAPGRCGGTSAFSGQCAHRHLGGSGQRAGTGRGGRRGCEVVEYSPNQVKGAVAGHGAADKNEVATMVQWLLGLSRPPHPADAADAAPSRSATSRSAASPSEPPADDRFVARHVAGQAWGRVHHRGRRGRVSLRGVTRANGRSGGGGSRAVLLDPPPHPRRRPDPVRVHHRGRTAVVRGADRRAWGGAGVGHVDPRGSLTHRAGARRGGRRCGCAVPGARGGKEDGGTAAGGAEEPAGRRQFRLVPHG
jgi:hypothetical protein